MAESKVEVVDIKLIPMSRAGAGIRGRGIVRRGTADRGRNLELILQAQQYWCAMDRFRRDRERNKRYLYGDQWGDMIRYKGEWMHEGELIARQGNVPLKNNLIRRLVRNVVGLYRNQNNEPTCVARDRSEQRVGQAMSTLLQYDMQLNVMGEIRAREMEEYCISGLVVERQWYGWANNKMDCWTTMVQPNNFIIDNNMSDVRGWDCSFVGEIHDVSFEALCSQFARNEGDYKWLSEVYLSAKDRHSFCLRWVDFGYNREQLYNYDFFITSDVARCRVIEIWRKETKARYRCHDWNSGEVYKIELKDRAVMVDTENARRVAQAREVGMPIEEVPLIDVEWFIDDYWKYYFLTPFGDILDEGETPFEHKSHPYVFKAYPFTDGEIHSFVSDVIDQQRFINRLIIMNDMAIRSSAKGLMMVPKECIPDGMDPEVFAEMSTEYNGMIIYQSKGVQHMPQIITSNSTNIGTTELLQIQMKIMEDASGVHGALQGQTPTSGTSGTLYAQQTQNATTSMVDLLMSFGSFVQDSAYKTLKNIQQFYDDRKIMEIVGSDIDIAVTADKIRNLEFDIAIQESQTTPVYREVANQFLLQLWQAGQISVEQLLEHGSFPFADELLQSIEAQKEEQAQQQAQQAQQEEQAQQQAQQAQQGQGQMPLTRDQQQAMMGQGQVQG